MRDEQFLVLARWKTMRSAKIREIRDISRAKEVLNQRVDGFVLGHGAWGLRGAPSRSGIRGITLLEMLIVVAIFGIVLGIAIPSYSEYLERGRILQAGIDIGQIADEIDDYFLDRNNYPDSLDDVDSGDLEDPWGNRYEFLRIDGGTANVGQLRKDKNLVPINSDYDLYSKGSDGRSVKPLTAKASRDDIIRADNGRFYWYRRRLLMKLNRSPAKGPMHRVLYRVRLLFMVVVLLPTLLAAGVSYLQVRGSLVDQAYERLHKENRFHSAQLLERLLRVNRDLKALREDPVTGMAADSGRLRAALLKKTTAIFVARGRAPEAIRCCWVTQAPRSLFPSRNTHAPRRGFPSSRFNSLKSESG
ncbi:MAG: prepilin-type N-terminal cleavage/methylation domain-containing protein [Halioglobus sp.]|nr:prepilin-type N-terminal cleavage/methylation domain-containing protein [Halioglobus sp.]